MARNIPTVPCIINVCTQLTNLPKTKLLETEGVFVRRTHSDAEPLPKKLADALSNPARYKERRPGSASRGSARKGAE